MMFSHAANMQQMQTTSDCCAIDEAVNNAMKANCTSEKSMALQIEEQSTVDTLPGMGQILSMDSLLDMDGEWESESQSDSAECDEVEALRHVEHSVEKPCAHGFSDGPAFIAQSLDKGFIVRHTVIKFCRDLPDVDEELADLPVKQQILPRGAFRPVRRPATRRDVPPMAIDQVLINDATRRFARNLEAAAADISVLGNVVDLEDETVLTEMPGATEQHRPGCHVRVPRRPVGAPRAPVRTAHRPTPHAARPVCSEVAPRTGLQLLNELNARRFGRRWSVRTESVGDEDEHRLCRIWDSEQDAVQ